MNPAARSARGYRSTCFLCGGAWGHCACSFPGPDDPGYGDAPGFDFFGVWVTDPTVSDCGRFFVDPAVYYGKAYLESPLAAVVARRALPVGKDVLGVLAEKFGAKW